jgi:hypothetical protein
MKRFQNTIWVFSIIFFCLTPVLLFGQTREEIMNANAPEEKGFVIQYGLMGIMIALGIAAMLRPSRRQIGLLSNEGGAEE